MKYLDYNVFFKYDDVLIIPFNNIIKLYNRFLNIVLYIYLLYYYIYK